MDLKLTSDGDLEIINGHLSWVTGVDAVRQKVAMRLRTWLGESVYDRSGGVPYREIIFRRGTTDISIRFIIENVLRSLPGVEEVLEVDVVRDSATRVVTITGRARAAQGEFPFEVTA